MRFLLDTHLLLWWLNGSPSLSQTARHWIADPNNLIFLSSINIWEIALRASLGKLILPPDFHRRWDGEGFGTLDFKAAHARRVAELPWHHQDPFDRALIAQAETENLLLLTADVTLKAYGECIKLV